MALRTFTSTFFNGWQEGKLQEVIDNCEVIDPNQPIGEINPQVGCTPQVGDFRFLTESNFAEGSVCDLDVRHLIVDEATDDVSSLPSGTCTGQLITKSWDQVSQDLFLGQCNFDETCTEKKGSQFFIKLNNNGEAKTKKCKWLIKKKVQGKKSWNYVCRIKDGNEDYDPANIVCPVTCETCGFSKFAVETETY